MSYTEKIQSHSIYWHASLLFAAGGLGYGSYILAGRVNRLNSEGFNILVGSQVGTVSFLGAELLFQRAVAKQEKQKLSQEVAACRKIMSDHVKKILSDIQESTEFTKRMAGKVSEIAEITKEINRNNEIAESYLNGSASASKIIQQQKPTVARFHNGRNLRIFT
jgi:citrate synthase